MQITRKRKQISKFWEILGCSEWRDLSAMRFSRPSVKRCRSYCPFLSFFFRIFQLWHLITRKRKQISKFWKILSCSERQDLSAVQFSWRSVKRCRSYCPFNVCFFLIFELCHDRWNDVGVIALLMLFFSYFWTLSFNISESMIAREIIPAGTCCIWCGEYDGAIEKKIQGRHFFQNGCHIMKMSTLSDCNENWYLGVLWCGEHDGNIEKIFQATIFFPKWPPYCEISTLSDFNENLDLGVISCGEHDGVIEIVIGANIFFPQHSANNGILLCCGSQVSDSGSWEPLVVKQISLTTCWAGFQCLRRHMLV